MAAVCWNQKEAMEKLASKGADMDMKNLRGETAYGKLVITLCHAAGYRCNMVGVRG